MSKARDIRKSTEYFIGLDIGTSSVGWAVANTKYELIKFNGKKMWGSRLFDEASTAEDRRRHRTSRRRTQRRVDRINLLEEIFSKEMAKVDPDFFMRLKESKFHLEDKSTHEKSIIFKGTEDGDKKYYEKYPTIYHLRNALMNTCDDVDIRELYIAVHHIIKYRGHFLFKGEITDSGTSIIDGITEIIDMMHSIAGMRKFDYSEKILNEIKEIIYNKDKTINDKEKDLGNIFNKDYKAYKAIFNLTVGSKVKLYDIFPEEEYKNLDDANDITFKNSEYEKERDKYELYLQDRIELIDSAKRIYDMILLLSIKPEGKGLSENKIDIYNKHHSDLELLKKVLRKDMSIYNKILREDKKNGTNYVNYIKKSKFGKGCSREDFYNLLKKYLPGFKNDDSVDYILAEIELERFLPLQRIKENSVIPYQIHRDELKKILNNASGKFDFLNEVSDGYSNIEKIIKLMEFRIPYYVGPLNDHHKVKDDSNTGFAWVVRKATGRVKPWNFDDLVDKEASAEKFIENLTNKCSYLVGKDVLPKDSLLYSEFCLLNELNNIMYDGKKISIEAKNCLIDNIFRKEKKKLTKNEINKFLKNNNFTDGKGEVTGIDLDIKSDLKSYRDMVKIFGANFNYKMAEDIIRWVTLFGESKSLLKSKITSVYGDKVNDEQLKKISKLRYRDWGKFSREFLAEIKSDMLISDETGEGQSIIEAMRNTDYNLMQLLRNEYDYSKKIDAINRENQSEIDQVSHDLLDNLYCSPAVKRSLWQTIEIVEEIKKIMGHEPKKVFVEVTRSNKVEKKRTDSRKKRLLELYKKIKNESRNWYDEIGGTEESKFNSKKLYLYYTQMGRCMYTGKNIDIESLFTDMYDIDHIFPRSKTKDNSFENLVLVTRKANSDKDDVYPLDPSIQNDRRDLWKFLHDKKLIGDKKYERLTRTKGFTEDEMSGFIARQLVETSQASKAAAEILNIINKESEIVYVKAENVSDFRHDNNFIKVREINDHHHAKDAYLNIVVGNVYNEKFTKNPANYIKSGGYKYSLNKLFERNLNRNDRVVWDKDKSMETVNRMMKSNDVRVTKKTIEQKGALYDSTVYKAIEAKKDSYFPLKMGDKRLRNVTKYGGYTSIKIAYYTVVEYNEKRKKNTQHIVRMIPVPVYINNTSKSFDDIEKYVENIIKDNSKYDLENFKVVYKKLYLNSVIELNGFRYYVGGRTKGYFYVSSAVQVIFDEEKMKVLKKIFGFINNNSIKKQNTKITSKDNINMFKYMVAKKNSLYFTNKKNNKVDEFNEKIVLEKFSCLSTEEQCKVLLGILNTLTDKSSSYQKYNLKSVGINMSRTEVSMKLSLNDSFKIINQSVTGLFENEIDILG